MVNLKRVMNVSTPFQGMLTSEKLPLLQLLLFYSLHKIKRYRVISVLTLSRVERCIWELDIWWL